MLRYPKTPLDSCHDGCTFNGPIEPDDSLCVVCGMTPEEKDSMASLDVLELAVLEWIVQKRVEDMWALWEIYEDPTLQ